MKPEQPKHWAMIENGYIVGVGDYLNSVEDMKAIGNYFDTKEEAEKAVEKLKAWKRLNEKAGDELKILFGGEE